MDVAPRLPAYQAIYGRARRVRAFFMRQREPFEALCDERPARIADAQTHTVVVLPFGLDQQQSRSPCTSTIAPEALRTKLRLTCWSRIRSATIGRSSASSTEESSGVSQGCSTKTR